MPQQQTDPETCLIYGGRFSKTIFGLIRFNLISIMQNHYGLGVIS
jgi:hypothetical protein